jgi:methionyl-tRNA formyltransferase
MRVAFAGTPEFAAVALQALHAAGYPIPLVLTQPDRPAGRGLKLQASPVKAFALAHGLPVAQPRSLRLDGKFPDDAEAARQALAAAAPDVMVVAAYGLILPAWTLAWPAHGCLNIHGSLLPRWRGAAPIHRAIEAGDTHTGITIMQMDAGLDTGPMLLRGAEPITPDDTTGSLHDRLAALGAVLIVQALQALQANALRPQPQPEAGVSYAHKVDKAEARVDWRQPAVMIERRVRAFDPFPGAVFDAGGEAVKLWQAALADDAGAATAPGTVLPAPPGTLRVACGEGVLDLLTLQRPGGRRAPAAAFLAARPMPVGTRLG